MNKKVTCETEIPGDFVHMIIGSAGSNIKKIQKHYNVKMLFLGQNHDSYLERKLQISGWEMNVENAQRVVENICKRNMKWTDVTKQSSNKMQQNGKSSNNSTDEEVEITDTFLIPSINFSRVIGLNGANLKMIKRVHNLKAVEAKDSVRISKNGNDMQSIILHGLSKNIESAKHALHKIVMLFSQNSRNYSNNAGQISSRNFDYRTNKMVHGSKTSSQRSSSEDELSSTSEKEYGNTKQNNEIVNASISKESNQERNIHATNNVIKNVLSSFIASTSLESTTTSNTGAIFSNIKGNFSKDDLLHEIHKITQKYEKDVVKLVADYIAINNPNPDFIDFNLKQNDLKKE